VAPGSLPHIQATLDTVSAQRRPLTDPLGLQPVLLAKIRDEPMRFGVLVAQTAVPTRPNQPLPATIPTHDMTRLMEIRSMGMITKDKWPGIITVP
jgi:hypothetical protein